MQKKVNEKIMHLAFIGGIIIHKNIYSDNLRKKIGEKLPDVIVKDAENSPAMGAVLMAKQILKI